MIISVSQSITIVVQFILFVYGQKCVSTFNNQDTVILHVA